ncbi:hypothetical protein ZIOFF_050431 [Zingiber officinale]|uniref:RNase H type-1 domain-containing protein n=1 Tax=Zingiber officinale TaxID=94328 RepID=A0A8J5FPW8_ZINOF|nr:hypothetical protein ZIOFF_050431 [Zingiber officinale]
MTSLIFRIWEEGVCLESNDLIQASGARFFEELLIGEDLGVPVSMDIMPQLVSSMENQALLALPSIEEVKQVDIIKEDVYQVVLDFFQGGSLPKGMVATTIVIIPKVDNVHYVASVIADFRDGHNVGDLQQRLAAVACDDVVLLPPVSILHQLEMMFANFFWGSSSSNKKPHWIGWVDVCKPRLEGGLGVCRLSDVATAVTLKHWFQFREQKSLWAIYMAKLYCGGVSSSVVGFLEMGKLDFGMIIGWTVVLFIFLVQFLEIRIIVAEIVDVSLPAVEGVSAWAENVERAGHTGVMDCIVWKSSLDGRFSMKTAWQCIRNDQQQAGFGQQDGVWSAVWSKPIFPNIFVFVCRFLRKRLPVDEVFCLEFDRFQVLERWRVGQFWSHGGHVREAIPFLIIWFLWYARNDAKHCGIMLVAKKIIWNVFQYLVSGMAAGIIKPKHWKSFTDVAHNLGFLVRPKIVNTISVVSWKKPKFKCFKLNVDGCSKGNPGVSSYGVIVRDHGSIVVMAKHGLIGVGSNVRAELVAILKDLELCMENQLFLIWLESDSLVALKILSSSYFSWEFGNLIRKIKGIICKHQVYFSHVYREANAVADYIANQAFNSPVDSALSVPLDLYTGRIFYNQDIDKELRGICNLDKSGLPYIQFSSKLG